MSRDEFSSKQCIVIALLAAVLLTTGCEMGSMDQLSEMLPPIILPPIPGLQAQGDSSCAQVPEACPEQEDDSDEGVAGDEDLGNDESEGGIDGTEGDDSNDSAADEDGGSVFGQDPPASEPEVEDQTDA